MQHLCPVSLVPVPRPILGSMHGYRFRVTAAFAYFVSISNPSGERVVSILHTAFQPEMHYVNVRSPYLRPHLRMTGYPDVWVSCTATRPSAPIYRRNTLAAKVLLTWKQTEGCTRILNSVSQLFLILRVEAAAKKSPNRSSRIQNSTPGVFDPLVLQPAPTLAAVRTEC